ncbi:hypothetical protein N5852_13255 [Bartonella sp. HY328]|uniref:hypothetical protein n=1 Tax=Bartonella sp. HY328 TaxID=2979320 RepID=UPI0021C81BAA|nr:hypothetical protein [Bartonella sp. HY328]UXN09353.1 hypothetical protein N5852_13255 [Bartonella sp. HY328]
MLHFFFDFGAGGCLWNGDKTSYELFDGGTLERAEFDLDGNMRELPFISLSKATLLLIDELDTINYYYLNQKYQPDPSPWRQSLCDEFNSKVDELLLMIIDQIGDKFEIVDTQIRYQEDPHLDAYLGQNPDVLALNTIADVKRLIEKERIFF